MESKLSSYKFFDLVLSGELGNLDIENYIQSATNNFDLGKLTLLLRDIEFCLSCEQEEKLSEFSEQDIWDEIDKLRSKGKEVPMITRSPMKNKKLNIELKFSPVLDTEKLLYPYYFYPIYHLISKINKLIKEKSESDIPEMAESNSTLLMATIGKFGFFELPTVKFLLEDKKGVLIGLIVSNGLPYAIAMFDFLGYLTYLEREHFTTKNNLNKEIAKWFNSDKDGRAVKGNISSLTHNSTENRARYTAYQHKERVKNDYQLLK